MKPEQQKPDETVDNVEEDFINAVRSQYSALMPEIASRNKRIADNDQYIYGEKLEKMLDIPLGHDMTPVNWLRRTVEIHRAQFMGKGFAIDSSYQAEDISAAGTANQSANGDPQISQQIQAEKQRLIIENEKKKGYAEIRRQLIEAIIRDNGGNAFWSTAAENASAVGDTVLKAWYDEDKKKYTIQQIETVENFYVHWSSNDYRQFDSVAYIYQIDKQAAIDKYGVSEDVVMSPLGTPLAVLTQSQVAQYISVQMMVTILEVTGEVEGWATDGKGHLRRCPIGKETKLNVIIVGQQVYQIIDDEKALPDYYILPNKRVRRRPWGVPDVSEAAIMINLTYIEALSDWRTLASKVNFPKFKGYGFGPGTQPPKPKPRTVEVLPLAEGQDIQPMTMGQSAQMGESDFIHQLTEMENQFVREVGISRQLFDMPDAPSNSNPAALTSMKSIGDITNAKRELWEPVIRQMFEDALRKLAKYDDKIKEVVDDDNWFIKVSWPSALNSDDPSYHAMLLNQFNTGLLSIQSLLEKLGYDKQEIDRIREEMEDPVTASIHGHILSQMAEYKLIPFGTPMPPKVNINLRGDMTPEQEGNVAATRGFNDGPFGTTMGPQGSEGLAATDNVINKGHIQGDQNRAGFAISTNAPTAPPTAPGGGAPAGGGTSPELINSPGANATPGTGIMSQPGSGAPMTSAKGKMAQHKQRQGK
jgi:hypothetical protein